MANDGASLVNTLEEGATKHGTAAYDFSAFPFHPLESPSNTKIQPFRGYLFRYRHIHANMPRVTSTLPQD
jgi:hypothetical protein